MSTLSHFSWKHVNLPYGLGSSCHFMPGEVWGGAVQSYEFVGELWLSAHTSMLLYMEHFQTCQCLGVPKHRLSGLTLWNPESLELDDAKGTSYHRVQQVIVYMARFGDNCPRISEVSQWILYPLILIPCQKTSSSHISWKLLRYMHIQS